VLTAKELSHLEDFLTMQQTWIKTLYFFANQVEDQKVKQILQDMAQRNQSQFQAIAKNLNAGATLH